LVALAVSARARDRGDPSRALDLDAAALPAERARLDVADHADPDHLAALAAGFLGPAERGVAGGGESALERLRIVPGVVDLAGGRPVREAIGRDQVATADLGGVELQRPRGRVHQPLDDEARLGAPRAAVRRDRGGVGEGALDRDVAGGYHVGAGQAARVVRG